VHRFHINEDDMTDWPEILEQHGGIVWKTVRRLIGNDADAGCCFQETFVAALEFSQKHSVRNWPGLLKRLATARALDHLRKRMRAATKSLWDRGLGELASPVRPPSSIAEENELFDQLRSALAALPPDQAEVCCLRYLEEMSYEQISEQLGATVNHVGVLLHRAKSSLQVRLAAFAPVACDKTENE
jgi:RNA polymerase sigma-70 factor (ECF subfamily)